MEWDWKYWLLDAWINTVMVLGVVSVIFGLYQLLSRICTEVAITVWVLEHGEGIKATYRYTVWGALIWITVGLWLFYYFRGY